MVRRRPSEKVVAPGGGVATLIQSHSAAAEPGGLAGDRRLRLRPAHRSGRPWRRTRVGGMKVVAAAVLAVVIMGRPGGRAHWFRLDASPTPTPAGAPRRSRRNPGYRR